jgi:hypothetical protein
MNLIHLNSIAPKILSEKYTSQHSSQHDSKNSLFVRLKYALQTKTHQECRKLLQLLVHSSTDLIIFITIQKAFAPSLG